MANSSDEQSDEVESVRSAVAELFNRVGGPEASVATGVGSQTISDFARRVVHKPRGKNWTALLSWFHKRKVSEPPARGVRETVAQYSATPLNPIEQIFAAGIAEQRDWLWRYTTAITRALAEHMEQSGPPSNVPPERAAMFDNMMAQDAADKSSAATPPIAAGS